jgi:hypothetical protein
MTSRNKQNQSILWLSRVENVGFALRALYEEIDRATAALLEAKQAQSVTSGPAAFHPTSGYFRSRGAAGRSGTVPSLRRENFGPATIFRPI